MPIVFLFGPDGSGKSTLADRAIEKLGRKSRKVKYGWMRGTHTFASVVARFLSLFSGFGEPIIHTTVSESRRR